MRSFTTRRSVAIVATVAMSTAGLIGLASSANAASTSLKFDCSASILSGQEFILNADITVPASVEVGQTVNPTFTGTVSAPDSTRGAAYSFLNGRALEGVATINAKFGAAPVTMDANLPKTNIPSVSGPMVLNTTGGGSFVAATAGTQDLTIGGFTAPLTMTKADGTTSPVNVTCTAKAPATVVASVNVVEPTVDPTPDPTDTPTPDPTDTPTPDPTATPTPTPTPTATATPTPTQTPSPTTPPDVKPDPIKVIVSALLGLLKKLVCKIIKC